MNTHKEKLAPLTEEDRMLFAEACRDVRPLVAEVVQEALSFPSPEPFQSRLEDRQVLLDSLDPGFEFDDAGEDDDYVREGIQRSVLRKLKKGQYCVNVGLDLHGLTAPQAAQAVTDFCAEARRKGARCVRIVHGKGYRSSNRGPVLKPLVRRLLMRRDDVLAFCPARANDGGSGALYVLLKRA